MDMAAPFMVKEQRANLFWEKINNWVKSKSDIQHEVLITSLGANPNQCPPGTETDRTFPATCHRYLFMSVPPVV